MIRAVSAALLMTASAASAQTIYRWTDSRGTLHFTDDPTSIPANAKVETTEGEELSNMGATKREPAPEPDLQYAQIQQQQQQVAKAQSDEEYWRQQFRTAREKVKSLEDELALDQRKFDDPSRMPMSGNYYCAPYGYGFAPGWGYGGGSFNQGRVGVGIRGSATIPLGNGAQVTLDGTANQTVQSGSSTVVPFRGYGNGTIAYGYGGPCWYAMDGDYGRTRERIDRNKLSLKRAQEELADLERRAANAAVPLEWRR